MKLTKFSVTNFRSITKAHDISISGTTVLVGKNNEGKSNLLRALTVAMGIISFYPQLRRLNNRNYIRVGAGVRRQGDDVYVWERDYPISLQSHKPLRPTIFRLEFSLSDDEINEFWKETKSTIDGTLPLEITIGKDEGPIISIVKGGRAWKTMNAKSEIIADYVSKRISFNYIPAIRTHNQAMSVISDLVSAELATLENDQNYKEALAVIEKMQQPLLKELSGKIKGSLSEFLPSIKGVDIRMNEDSSRTRYRRDFDVYIDDGTLTNIEHKGDGVKSLATLGLLKNRKTRAGASVIAIEEPESHLHSGAIHQLREIISSLEGKSQVVITTHNPLFVNCNSVGSNIIVDDGNAKKATNIKQIRDILGVRISDNLTSSRFVLVVEGAKDKKSLSALLPVLSPQLGQLLRGQQVAILSTRGAGGLSYVLSTLESQCCGYHVLLDHDLSANNAKDKAIDQGLLTEKYLTQTICRGMPDAEFEDCIRTELYADALLAAYGVDVTLAPFKGSHKWSDRMKKGFEANGKQFTDNLKAKVKDTVADCVVKDPTNALCPHKRNAIDALVAAVEKLAIEQQS